MMYMRVHVCFVYCHIHIHVAFLLAYVAASLEPLTAYDKNGIKIVFHFGKDNPRPDVRVVVVSVMSTNTDPVKSFIYQAAVPKVNFLFYC